MDVAGMTGKRLARSDEGKTKMSIKHVSAVNEYTARVMEIQAVLANLAEWAESLPAPDEEGTIHSLHYGHLGSIQEIHKLLGEISRHADGFHE